MVSLDDKAHQDDIANKISALFEKTNDINNPNRKIIA